MLKALIRGLLIVVPVYLAIILMLKGMKSVANLVSPFAKILPEWLPAEEFLSLLLVLAIVTMIGASVGTRAGESFRGWVETALLEKIPGYSVIRGLTQQLAGRSVDNTWKAAFIIEELDDGRYTVFVPSIPTPFAGAVFVVDRKRVHPVDVPFTDVVRVVSRWGSGAKDLVAAMQTSGKPAERATKKASVADPA